HVGFQVRGRAFAWFVDDEHGDGRVAVLCKAPAGENTALVASDPHRFYLPRYVGNRGWVGLGLDRQDGDWGGGGGRRAVSRLRRRASGPPPGGGGGGRAPPRLSYTAAVLPLPGVSGYAPGR